MSFEIRSNETLRKVVRRISRTLLKDASRQISESASASVDETVHEVRKSFKRMRALLRLVRFAVGESAYQLENESFRDAGRPLSELRDAKILIEALDRLKDHYGDEADSAPIAAARKKLILHQQEVRKKFLEEQGALATVESFIRDALERIEDWSDVSNRWRELGLGGQRVYRRGKKAFCDAKSDASIEGLHEWRKQVKYLRYQLELLTPLGPEVLNPLACQAEKLGELLGDDHDLAVLRRMLSDNAEVNCNGESTSNLTALIDRRRDELQAEAFPRGELLYRENSRQFINRLKGYWKRRRKNNGRPPAGKRSR